MQMDIIVESEDAYNAWLAEQKTFAQTNGTQPSAAVVETAAPVEEEAEATEEIEGETEETVQS